MTAIMSKSRVWITVDEEIKRAFEAQASSMGMTSGELLTKIVNEEYPETLAHVRKLMQIHSPSAKRKDKS